MENEDMDSPTLNTASALSDGHTLAALTASPRPLGLTLDGPRALTAPLVIGADPDPSEDGYVAGPHFEGVAWSPQGVAGQGAALMATAPNMDAVAEVKGPELYGLGMRRMSLMGCADGTTRVGLHFVDARGSQRTLEEVYISQTLISVLNGCRFGRNGEGLVLNGCLLSPLPGGTGFLSVNGQSYYNTLRDCAISGNGITQVQLGPDAGGALGFGLSGGYSGTLGVAIDAQGRSIPNTVLRLIGTDGAVEITGGKRVECLGPTCLLEWSGGSPQVSSTVRITGKEFTGFRYEHPFLDGTLNVDGDGQILRGRGLVNGNHTIVFEGCTFESDACGYTADATGDLPALPRPAPMPLSLNWQPGDQSYVKFVNCTWRGDWGDLSALFAHPVNDQKRGGIEVADCWRQASGEYCRLLTPKTAAL